MSVPQDEHERAEHALRDVISGFVVDNIDLFAPLVLAYLHHVETSCRMPHESPASPHPMPAFGRLSPLLDTMLGRYVAGRSAVAAHGTLAAARLFRWIVTAVCRHIDRDLQWPELPRIWIDHNTPPATAHRVRSLPTSRAWPSDPVDLPIRLIDSDDEMLRRLRRHAMRIRRRRGLPPFNDRSRA